MRFVSWRASRGHIGRAICYIAMTKLDLNPIDGDYIRWGLACGFGMLVSIVQTNWHANAAQLNIEELDLRPSCGR